MPDTETPILHLGLSDDERINRNLLILDSFIGRMATRQVITEDLLIQGNLEVLLNAIVRGDLTVDGALNLNELNVSNLGAVNALISNLTVDGTVELPFQSVAPNALARGAGLFDGVAGAPLTTPLPLVDFE